MPLMRFSPFQEQQCSLPPPSHRASHPRRCVSLKEEQNVARDLLPRKGTTPSLRPGSASSSTSESESTRLGQAASWLVEHSQEHVGRPQNLQQPNDAGGRSSVGTPQPAHRLGPACPSRASSPKAPRSARCARSVAFATDVLTSACVGHFLSKAGCCITLPPVASARAPRSPGTPGLPAPYPEHSRSECATAGVPTAQR